MKATPVTLPTALQMRLGVDAPAPFMAVGNAALLAGPLLGLIASRQCPGHILLQTLELAAQWARAQQVVLSGFHSPLAHSHCVPHLSPDSPLHGLMPARPT